MQRSYVTQLRPLRLATAAILAASIATAGCNRLSPKAEAIAGNYYIPEISEEEPLLELRRYATLTLRAIKPGVLTYSIDGTWDVAEGATADSLVAMLDPATLKWNGDSSLIGDIPRRYAKRITEISDLTITIEKEGVAYVYHRRQ